MQNELVSYLSYTKNRISKIRKLGEMIQSGIPDKSRTLQSLTQTDRGTPHIRHRPQLTYTDRSELVNFGRRGRKKSGMSGQVGTGRDFSFWPKKFFLQGYFCFFALSYNPGLILHCDQQNNPVNLILNWKKMFSKPLYIHKCYVPDVLMISYTLFDRSQFIKSRKSGGALWAS